MNTAPRLHAVPDPAAIRFERHPGGWTMVIDDASSDWFVYIPRQADLLAAFLADELPTQQVYRHGRAAELSSADGKVRLWLPTLLGQRLRGCVLPSLTETEPTATYEPGGPR